MCCDQFDNIHCYLVSVFKALQHKPKEHSLMCQKEFGRAQFKGKKVIWVKSTVFPDHVLPAQVTCLYK